MLDLLIKDTPNQKDVQVSLEGFLHRVQRSLHRWGVGTLDYDLDLLKKAHHHALKLLRSYQDPSCFKAAAAMSMGLVSAEPISTTLPNQFGNLKDKQNAVFGILESVYWMHDAELLLHDGTLKILSQQIDFSYHFFDEFVTAVDGSGWPTPMPTSDFSAEYHTRFRLLALNFESLAYQNNKTCKYPPPENLQLDKYFNTLESGSESPVQARCGNN